MTGPIVLAFTVGFTCGVLVACGMVVYALRQPAQPLPDVPCGLCKGTGKLRGAPRCPICRGTGKL